MISSRFPAAKFLVGLQNLICFVFFGLGMVWALTSGFLIGNILWGAMLTFMTLLGVAAFKIGGEVLEAHFYKVQLLETMLEQQRASPRRKAKAQKDDFEDNVWRLD